MNNSQLLRWLIKDDNSNVLADFFPAARKSSRAFFTVIEARGLEFRVDFNAAHPEKAATEKVNLTKREAEILSFIAEGFSGEEISKNLYVTPINIRVITSKIYSKLGVNSRLKQ